MRELIGIIVISVSTLLGSQKSTISGKYYWVNSQFEKTAKITLTENGRFIYESNLSACQTDVTGTYYVQKNLIIFKNDKEYTQEYLKHERDSINAADPIWARENPEFANVMPYYPDMSLIKWKVGDNYIKPISKFNTGCFIVKGKFYK